MHNASYFYIRRHMNIGDIYGRWKVIAFDGDGYATCECQCSNHTIKHIKMYTLEKGTSKSCGCLRRELNSKNKATDINGMTFGEWTVLKYLGKSMWLCRCSCGKEKSVRAQSLKSGVSKSCGHDTTQFKDLSNSKINHWKVLEYVGNGNYKCECDCINHTVKIVSRSNLVTGASKSCGCGHSMVNIIDLTGKRFGKLIANRYIGNNFWECICTECGNVSVHNGEHLRRNESNFTCSICDSNIYDKEYVVAKLEELTKNLDRKPFRTEIANYIGVGMTTVARYIDRFKLDTYINNEYRSFGEMELHKLFPEAIINSRKYLGNGQEIDIYLEDKKVGIEFNGGYWHSDIYKDKDYHKNKVILAESLGIHLINIYEYEWNNDTYRSKIVKYLNRIIDNNNINKIYARNTQIRLIENSEAIEFCNKYHLQNGIAAQVNIALMYDNEIVALMSFGNPRFDKGYDYEMLRMAYKDNISIIGGTEKMFSYFIKEYKPKNIISYCNIDIFSGKAYERIGMQLDGYTSPGYIWWNCKIGDKSSVLNRYSTTKSKLIAKGLGSLGDTEDEIMRALGYYKIYNSGNKRFVWKTS